MESKGKKKPVKPARKLEVEKDLTPVVPTQDGAPREGELAPRQSKEAGAPFASWVWLREWLTFGLATSSAVLAYLVYRSNSTGHSPTDRITIATAVARVQEERVEGTTPLYSLLERLDGLEKLEPNNPTILIEESIIEDQLGQSESAAQNAEKAYGIAPASYSAVAQYAITQAKAGNDEVAKDAFEDAKNIAQTNHEAWMNAAAFYAKKQQAEKALENISKAVNLKPDSVIARFKLASLLEDQKKYQEAIDVYFDAVRHFPENAKLRYRLGVLLARENRFKEAREALEAAFKLDHRLIPISQIIIDDSNFEVILQGREFFLSRGQNTFKIDLEPTSHRSPPPEPEYFYPKPVESRWSINELTAI